MSNSYEIWVLWVFQLQWQGVSPGEGREWKGDEMKRISHLGLLLITTAMCMIVVLPSVDKGSVASTANAFASLTMDDRVSEEEEDEGGIPQELPEHACRYGGLALTIL